MEAWDKAAERAIAAGAEELRGHLHGTTDCRGRPPSGAGAFLSLFVWIHDYLGLEGSAQHELYRVVTETLETFDQRGRRSSNDTSSDAERRRALESDKSIVLFNDVFRQSMYNWEDHEKQRISSTLDTYPVTELIWNVAHSKLYDQGALHVCAEFGQEDLLRKVLTMLKGRVHSREDAIGLLFQPGPRTGDTPLGWAIRGQYTGCVSALLNSPLGKRDDIAGYQEDIAKYVMNGNSVLYEDEQNKPVLHETLKIIQRTAGIKASSGMTAVEEFLDCAVVLIQEVVLIEPQLLCQKDADGNTPYQRAHDIGNIFGHHGIEEKIKELIFQLRDPDHWREALSNKRERDKQICLDLSDFSYEPNHFGDFVTELDSFDQSTLGKKWQFWETLLYLDLPPLTVPHAGDATVPSRCDINMVGSFLKWLNEKKHVTKIIRLKIPDSGHQYSAQFVEHEILNRFEIDELDWQVVDIEVSCILELSASTPPTKLKKLHLYSHGEEAKIGSFRQVLDLIRDGEVFSEVADINLALVDKARSKPNREMRRKAKETIRQALQIFGRGKNFHDEPRRGVSEYEEKDGNFVLTLEGDDGVCITFAERKPLSWGEFVSRPTLFRRQEADDEQVFQVTKSLESCHNFLDELNQFSGNASKDSIQHCLNVMRTQKVKVAIIDNGADQMRGTISANIEYGMSFTTHGLAGGPYLPWYTAADPHGTQMAYLIRNVNPYCRLYPLRAGSLREDINPVAAAKAIEWAMDHDIDIISISWIVKDQSPELKRAVKAATEKGLIFCSTADIGAQSDFGIWPADYENVIIVSASSVFGLPLPRSLHDVHVMLPGDEVAAHGPNYMRSLQNTRISGSSVATALAAGLASLCLFLARMINRDGNAEKFKKRQAMLWLFGQMQLGDNKVLVPSRLFEHFDTLDRLDGAQGALPTALDKFKYSHFMASEPASSGTPGSPALRHRIPRRARSQNPSRVASAQA